MMRELLFAAIAAIGGIQGICAQSYTFQVILYCDSLAAFPAGMNGNGVVVGVAYTSSSTFGSGMVFENGSCRTYSPPGGLGFLGISDAKAIVGYGMNGVFIDVNGTRKPLPSYPGAFGTNYCCITSGTGILAGNYYPTTGGTLVGFVYHNGQFHSLPYKITGSGPLYWYSISAMNDKGVIVGTCECGSNLLGFVYENGQLTRYNHPGSGFTYFQGINDNGLVVGSYSSNSGPSGFFLFDMTTKTWTDVNFPFPYNGSTPVGISNTGVIAALYGATGGMLIATPTGN